MLGGADTIPLTPIRADGEGIGEYRLKEIEVLQGDVDPPRHSVMLQLAAQVHGLNFQLDSYALALDAMAVGHL